MAYRTKEDDLVGVMGLRVRKFDFEVVVVVNWYAADDTSEAATLPNLPLDGLRDGPR